MGPKFTLTWNTQNCPYHKYCTKIEKRERKLVSGELETIEGVKFKPIWNRQPCFHYDYCTKKKEREKTLVLGKCMYNPSVFECEEFQKLNERTIYSLDLL